jgi:osmotically-inducible protein OsmY
MGNSANNRNVVGVNTNSNYVVGVGQVSNSTGTNPTSQNSLNANNRSRTQQPGQQGNQATSNTTSIRTQLVVAFDRPSADGERTRQISESLSKRLSSLPGIHWSRSAQIEIQGRTAILRGVVATAHDRDLAERVLRLESAIDQVQNQLEVAANSDTP